MHFTIINNSTGETFDMQFDTHEQKEKWLDLAKGFECLGELKDYLPTRHERMKNKKEDFAGWGS
jgi:hypothetical protein